MSVTRRFVGLAMCGVPLLLLATLLPAAVTSLVFWLYNMILFGLLAMDFILSPAASSLAIKREGESVKLSHQAINRVTFTVCNTSNYVLLVEAKDEVISRHFTVSRTSLRHSLRPGEERSFAYSVLPSKRGAFTFPYVHLRIRGLLGLVMKYHSHKCPGEFKVYPNTSDLHRFRIMTQKNRLLPRGEKPLRIFGPGTEFESLRAYVEGDDYRKINWPVSAREMRPIVNDYQIEKNQPVFMLLDCGRPMSYSVKGYRKLDYAINAALVLSDIVGQKGDQSGLLAFDTNPHVLIMPGKGHAHRNSLMESLYHLHGTRSTSNYGAAFRMLCQRQKRRSLVFIFTDFETLEEGGELCSQISLLKRRHFPIVVFMKNEELERLAGPAPDSDEYVQEVAQSFLAERKQLFSSLNGLAIPNVETAAEQFSVTAVNQYLALRRA